MRTLMRSIGLLTTLAVSSGCRPPSIRPEIQKPEYDLLHDLLQYESATIAPDGRIAVDPDTLRLTRPQYQFEGCLPGHLRDVFDNAPPGRLSPNVPTDWLSGKDARKASLQTDTPATPPDGETAYLKVSRVAFNPLRSDAYLWVDRTVCTSVSGKESPACETGGNLLHAKKHDGAWTFEETECRTLSFDR